MENNLEYYAFWNKKTKCFMRQGLKGDMEDAKNIFGAKWFDVEQTDLWYMQHLQKVFRIKSKTKIVKISLSHKIIK